MQKFLRLITILVLALLITPPISSASSLTLTDSSTNYLPMIVRASSACTIFPENNIWNTPVDSLPVHSKSNSYIASIGRDDRAHADFGSGEWPPGSGSPIGIPFVTVPGSQAMVPIHYIEFGDESDAGPFPIPMNAPIEGGPSSDGDRHVLVIDRDRCKLYELYNAYPRQNGGWDASSGAVFDLTTNGPLRPSEWTSADAAGLPIFPGLVRYDEMATGEIRHALRFTAPYTQHAYVWPARHRAGSNNSDLPPMGQRFRLKASFTTASAPAQLRPILVAMKKYGIILADNGSPWYFSGAPDPRWDNDALHWLDNNLSGMDFEAVDATTLMINVNSGEAKQP